MKARSTISIALLIMSSTAPSLAAEAQHRGRSDMVVTVSPYVWAPTVTGHVALGPLSVPVRVTPADLAEGIKIAGMGRVRADVERKYAYVEAIFADSRNSRFKPFFGQGVTSKIRFGEFGLGITRQLRFHRGREVRISPHIGVQHLRIDALVFGDLLNANASGRWTNVAAGVEVELPLSERLGLTGKFDGAGFGVARTDYRSAAVAIDLQLTRRLWLSGGYRADKGKFQNPRGLALDVRGDGPTIGLRYRH